MANGQCIAGIFVGGQSNRMQGTPKGLLQPPDSPLSLVEQLVQQLTAANILRVVLVGRNDAYVPLAFPVILDAPIGSGPMAGLLGLVDHAQQNEAEFVLALACDMPNLDAALLRRLLDEQPRADALVPRREQWEPLCARYRVSAVRPQLQRLLAAGQYRMTGLLDSLGSRCAALALDRTEQSTLADWDSPSDLPEGVQYLGRPYPRSGR